MKKRRYMVIFFIGYAMGIIGLWLEMKNFLVLAYSLYGVAACLIIYAFLGEHLESRRKKVAKQVHPTALTPAHGRLVGGTESEPIGLEDDPEFIAWLYERLPQL